MTRRTNAKTTEKALALRRQGLSYAKIGAKLGVSASTVHKWLSDAEERGEHVPKLTSRGRPRKAKPTPKTKAPTGAKASPKPSTSRADRIDPYEELRLIREEEMPRVKGAADRALEENNVTVYRDLVKARIDMAERLAAAQPPEPPDPEDDPANAKARERVRQLRDRLLAARDREAAALLKKCCDDCRALVAPWIGLDPVTLKSTDPREAAR